MKVIHTYGGEIEKPVTDLSTGLPHRTSQKFFSRLAEGAKKRRTFTSFHHSDIEPKTTLGVVSKDVGEQGLDNGFNLLEGSVAYQTSLAALHKVFTRDLETVQESLAKEHATVVNLAIHPLGKRDFESYLKFVAPKGIYPYLWYRGWDHTAGIDARAQNSPSTGVAVEEAADAVSVIIGAGAAFIGLFANSPYEEGKRSSFKESRTTMWPRMMRRAKFEGDRTTARFPEKRFRTMAQYFQWMFGSDTSIYFVLAEQNRTEGHADYKGIGERILIIEGNPTVLGYLEQPSWYGYYLCELQQNGFPPKGVVTVKPKIADMETLQFAQFAGARIRYGLRHEGFPIRKFVEVCRKTDKREVERLFNKWSTYTYIEGRDAGANFPDQELWEAGKEIAESVITGPSALQAGLLHNLSAASRYIDSFEWQHLNALRNAAIKDGLQGEANEVSVYKFAQRIVEIAAGGLTPSEQQFLAYPLWVLKRKKNGADRAIEFVEKQTGNVPDRLKKLMRKRACVVR